MCKFSQIIAFMQINYFLCPFGNNFVFVFSIEMNSPLQHKSKPTVTNNVLVYRRSFANDYVKWKKQIWQMGHMCTENVCHELFLDLFLFWN